ncbi:hypothetical protein I4U23_031478 [Adineta vaga]|nr:hypothetical protein I4U23_031478 [Adineta vaga]
MASSSLPFSDFYEACRDNNIDLVKSFIETMTSDEIKRLFYRQYSSNRFVGNLNDTLEWIRIGYYKYIEKIQWYFDETNKTNHPKYILQFSTISISNVRYIAEDFATETEFPREQEVHLISYSAFEVIHIQEIQSHSGNLTQIELCQCKSNFQAYAALAAGGGGCGCGYHSSITCPEDVIKSQFSNGYHHHRLQYKIKSKFCRYEITQKELDIAAEFGQFSHRPSDLFLKIFYNVICTLEYNPLVGCVSPSLIGSSGIIPLTIISTIPDIMHHYYHVIINAQKEILFTTMYWEKSESSNVICQAFYELNKRAGNENRHIIIKLMIDHPKFSNIIQYHSILPSNKWSYYDLPDPKQIPNLSLEVHNYHHFIMGTFHTKFLIIDRKLVLLNSNNIQDRPNLEMMIQYQENLTFEFTPFIFHHSHQPFPIALVSRLAHGTPAHNSKHNPQNMAWISAFKYAQRSIFIQTPTLNASPAIKGIIDACKRGIKVILWVGWGFNDLKEGRGTLQGGTNEQVIKKLYKILKKTKNRKEQNLEVFWYVAKDQTRPIHFLEKKRNCHIKFMSIDDQIAILGNANMDSLSWFHSQEINTMIDSPEIVQEWINTLYKNQSTTIYGKLNTDGIWCDRNE